jgi:DNA-binding transcriptional LysR family regulator
MNITAIQTFLSVVRLRNLNRAAEEMNVTQSAVTARLDALDQALYTRLLNRSRKGATLTKEGYAFLEQAQVIVRMWDTARAKNIYPKGVTHLFSLVCDPGLWAHLAEPWIEQLRINHAETAFEIWTARERDALDWLSSGMSDAALLSGPLHGAEFETRVFSTDVLTHVSTEPRAAVAWDSKYVLVDYGPGFRAQHAQAWKGDETATISFSNPEWALAHILTHGGSAYLPDRMVAAAIRAEALFSVQGSPSFISKTYLSWRKARAENFAWLSEPFT